MANLQKDGTYSVVPRIAGGEVTPEGLIAIGEVAKDFGLYTKITGGQRIDMFGARIDQLPLIWQRLVDAGFESGHAYGKSLRTVKSCVGLHLVPVRRAGLGRRWRSMLELRYRGLRSPHKIKLGVSGCARECAEARGKDVGVIATDKGWNVYVGGNGGFTPRHAQLLAEDLDTETLVRTIDRFLMYYVRTADRLQRTAPWIEDVEGGLDGVREVIMEDSLGIAADLDAQMAQHVVEYEDEWRATLEDPEKLRRFASFVNAPDDAGPVARVRAGARPAPPRHERRSARPASSSRVPKLEVRRMTVNDVSETQVIEVTTAADDSGVGRWERACLLTTCFPSAARPRCSGTSRWPSSGFPKTPPTPLTADRCTPSRTSTRSPRRTSCRGGSSARVAASPRWPHLSTSRCSPWSRASAWSRRTRAPRTTWNRTWSPTGSRSATAWSTWASRDRAGDARRGRARGS